VPRNRIARAAVLAGSVQRSAASSYSSRNRSVVRRRVVLGILVLLALVLITVSVREGDSGPVHKAQDVGTSVLRPFQVGAERVARPFRDVYGYFAGLVNAKSENEKLRREVEALRQAQIQNTSAVQDLAQLRQALRYEDGPQFPVDYRPVNTRVIGVPAGPFQQRVVIAAGSTSGLRLHSPIVSIRGELVGQVTRVAPHTAVVTLLTDPDSAVAAVDEDPSSRAIGLLLHGPGGDTLALARVTKDKVVNRGDVVVTAGTQNARYPDLYPRGILIGTVGDVSQTNIAPFKQIQVNPFVDFSSLDSVVALVAKKPIPQLP
jgi:rod shape-determining protein MreC